MDDNQRLQLKNMINENNVIDKTDLIRSLKHSSILRNEINEMIKLKKSYKNDINSLEFTNIAMSKCNILCSYYTDIFNFLKKDEINVNRLFDFLDILEKIELGSLDQHEASFQVGSILKDIYVDCAIKRCENLEKKSNENNVSASESASESSTNIDNVSTREPPKNISWNHFKKIKKIKSLHI